MATQSAVASQTCRLLFYGPKGAGKRDNLRRIMASLPPENRLSLDGPTTAGQVAFRLQSGGQGDWMVTAQAIDPGREPYPDQVDQDQLPFDGIVFVAHASASRLDQTLSSLEGLKAYLDIWGQDVTTVPIVIQYNMHQESDCLPVDRLESLMNPWGLLSFPANTSRGEGVKETLKAILTLSISMLVRKRHSRDRQPAKGDGSGVGRNCPGNEAEKRPDGQASVPEPDSRSRASSSDLQIVAEERGGLFFEDLRPPIVIPVRIPRRLLEKFNSARVILEIEIDDRQTLLS